MTNTIEYVYRRTLQNSGEEDRKMLGRGGRERNWVNCVTGECLTVSTPALILYRQCDILNLLLVEVNLDYE